MKVKVQRMESKNLLYLATHHQEEKTRLLSPDFELLAMTVTYFRSLLTPGRWKVLEGARRCRPFLKELVSELAMLQRRPLRVRAPWSPPTIRSTSWYMPSSFCSCPRSERVSRDTIVSVSDSSDGSTIRNVLSTSKDRLLLSLHVSRTSSRL